MTMTSLQREIEPILIVLASVAGLLLGLWFPKDARKGPTRKGTPGQKPTR